MADENNSSSGGGVPVAHETAEFTIGGERISVPALNLDILDRMRDEIRSLSGDMLRLDFAKAVLRIVAARLETDAARAETRFASMMSATSFPETNGIIDSWLELSRISGLGGPPSGEEFAASPGTGTSNGSSQNSESAESAAETPTP